MNRFIILILILFASLSYASMPVEVTITGCAKDGEFLSEETDFGTHKVSGTNYKIKLMDNKTNAPIDITPYNNKKIRIKGYLLPGDIFPIDKEKIEVIGDCLKSNKLSIEEQEKLARELFIQMSKADKYDTELFIKLYNRVINECPDTEKAQEAYWRLTNLYLQAFDEPDYAKIVELLEDAVKKYPNTSATQHYKQRLLLAYVESKQWGKAIGLYEETINKNPDILSNPDNAATLIDYAECLINTGNREKALKILNKVVDFGDKIESWLLDIAKANIEVLKNKQ